MALGVLVRLTLLGKTIRTQRSLKKSVEVGKIETRNIGRRLLFLPLGHLPLLRPFSLHVKEDKKKKKEKKVLKRRKSPERLSSFLQIPYDLAGGN